MAQRWILPFTQSHFPWTQLEPHIQKAQQPDFKTLVVCQYTRTATRIHQHLQHLSAGLYLGSVPLNPTTHQVAICTAEKFDLLTRRWTQHWDWIPQVGLLVMEDLTLLGHPVRGPLLEAAMVRFLQLNPFCNLLACTRPAGAHPTLAHWLKAEVKPGLAAANPLTSQLTGQHLALWILHEIQARSSRNLSELEHQYQHTLRHQQAPEALDPPLCTLLQSGLLTGDPEQKLSLTPAGWEALSPAATLWGAA